MGNRTDKRKSPGKGGLKKRIIDLALQGKLIEAIEACRSWDQPLTVVEERFRKAFLNRFTREKSIFRLRTKEPLIREIYRIYASYWHACLLGLQIPDAAEQRLRESLARMLHEQCLVPDTSMELNGLEKVMTARLGELGYHCIFGVVQPFREFQVWASQTETTYKIDLPEGHQSIAVVMMDDFISHGWEGYATLDRAFPGGWASAERIFCASATYDLESEKFRVSFLAHEAQHFQDFSRFPQLTQVDLEYRAKLTELTMASRTCGKLLDDFWRTASPNRHFPHSMANYMLCRDFSLIHGIQWPSSTPPELRPSQINITARNLLQRSSQALAG